MLLGASSRTTSFLFMPSLRKPWASLATCDLRCAKVSVWEEWESTRAILDGKEELILLLLLRSEGKLERLQEK